MMRTSQQPLAHLVDRAAERWLAVEQAASHIRLSTEQDIVGAFNIGAREKMTFHGHRYLLSVINAGSDAENPARQYRIEIHEIARD